MNTPHKNKLIQEFSNISRIHFVGIGGTGMSGIAEVLLNLGYEISGSDIKPSAVTKRLEQQGIVVYIGHQQKNIKNADVVVISTAVDKTNQEVKAAYNNGIPVIPRAEMLAELMRFRFGIAVAGTHGKTTTTCLTASILAEGGLDPTFVIGGQLNSIGANAKLGLGKHLVAEADESDASFLYLQPMMAIVTNIDYDHMETYGGSFLKLKETFLEFLHHLPFYGVAVVCIDDAGVRNILPEITRPIQTYGVHKDADVRAINVQQKGMQICFTIVRKIDNYKPLTITLNMPGWHNMLNALAAITVATSLGVDNKEIINSMATFKGISRRFQLLGDIKIATGHITLVDDYAHHPREIEAVLESLHQVWPTRRKIVIFQPHRYTRTRDLFEDFVTVLSTIEVLILLNIYAAGEAEIIVANGEALSKAIRNKSNAEHFFVKDQNKLASILTSIVLTNDVILTLGAGNIGQIATELSEKLLLTTSK